MKLKYFKAQNLVHEKQDLLDDQVNQHILTGVLLFRNYHFEHLYCLDLSRRLLTYSYLIFTIALSLETLTLLNLGIFVPRIPTNPSSSQLTGPTNACSDYFNSLRMQVGQDFGKQVGNATIAVGEMVTNHASVSAPFSTFNYQNLSHYLLLLNISVTSIK